jgi:hypothetical protein
MVQIIKKENNKEVVRTEDQMNSFAGNMWKQKELLEKILIMSPRLISATEKQVAHQKAMLQY